MLNIHSLSTLCVTLSGRWLLAIVLLLLSGAGSGGTTKDYTWLLLLKVNEPPQVYAGMDQEITWADYSLYLDATVTDDPMDTLTYTWSKVSGPGSVTFSAPFSEDTTATFSASGIYILQLSASDGRLTSKSTVTIILNNSAPQVYVGTDKQITDPTNNVYLNATVSDHPEDSLSYTWSKVSGPGSVNFSTPFAEDTNVTMYTVGTYSFQLRASDGELASTDTVTVNYLPQPVDKIDVIVAVGDSITVGFGDSDCVYQNAKACSGYTPRLKNKLAGTAKYAAGLIIQERGTGGTTSANGLSVIDSIIGDHPYADQYLVMYGTNDAAPDPPTSKTAFKYNMRRIAEKINAVRGMNPVLAKAPYAIGVDAYRNVAIQQYNQAVQELYLENGFITISPPDFYSYFQGNTGQIWPYHMFTRVPEGVHPRAAGYDAMANIWFNLLK